MTFRRNQSSPGRGGRRRCDVRPAVLVDESAEDGRTHMICGECGRSTGYPPVDLRFVGESACNLR